MANKNFQIILEKNRYFLKSINDLLEKNMSKERKKVNRYEETVSFKKDLIDGNLMKCFSNIKLDSLKDGILSIDDNQGTTWKFSIGSEVLGLIEVSRRYIINESDRRNNKIFFVKHNAEKSFIEDSTWNLADPLNVEFQGQSLTPEDIDLVKITNDYDLSFLEKMNINDFTLNRKNKTIFQQNYEKHFGNKSYLFRKKR